MRQHYRFATHGKVHELQLFYKMVNKYQLQTRTISNHISLSHFHAYNENVFLINTAYIKAHIKLRYRWKKKPVNQLQFDTSNWTKRLRFYLVMLFWLTIYPLTIWKHSLNWIEYSQWQARNLDMGQCLGYSYFSKHCWFFIVNN